MSTTTHDTSEVLISKYWDMVGRAIVTILALNDHINTPNDIINAIRVLLVLYGVVILSINSSN